MKQEISEEEFLKMSEEEQELYLKKRESDRQLKAILYFVLPFIIIVLICAFYFIQMLEERSKKLPANSDTKVSMLLSDLPVIELL